MATYKTLNGNFFTTFLNAWEAGFYHNGKKLLKVATPNETSWALANWANESSEVEIEEPTVKFGSNDQILEDGRASNDVSENWVSIAALNFEEFCGYNNDYGIWGANYYDNE